MTEKCIYCNEPLDEFLTREGLNLHPECAIRTVTDSAEHLKRTRAGLPCGPECHVPEETMTMRESAKAAHKVWFEMQELTAIHGYVYHYNEYVN